MLQKQANYYHARFTFAAGELKGEKGIGATGRDLLQRCNYDPDPTPLNPLVPPLRMYLIPQMYDMFMQMVLAKHLSIESREYIENNGKPYYLFKIADRFYATIHRNMHGGHEVWAQFHYLSHQFDEYYTFCSAYPGVRKFNFFNPFDVANELMTMILLRQFTCIDWSTQMIPE